MRGSRIVVKVSALKVSSEYSFIMKRETEQYTASQMKPGGFFTDKDLLTFGSSTDSYIFSNYFLGFKIDHDYIF